MSRVKRGVTAHARHKKVLDQAKGVMEQELQKRKAEASELAHSAEEAAMTAFNEARAEGEEERQAGVFMSDPVNP